MEMTMTGILQDVRYAWRQWRKNPGFAVSAIAVLALGIGATTGMLAIVQSVLLRPLGYRQPERLLLVGTSETDDESYSVVSIADFKEMQRSLHQFEQLSAFNSLPVPVETDDGAEMLLAPEVSTNFFDTLGVFPVMGRPFRNGDDAPGAGAAIVSHEFWQNTMHSSRAVLDSKLKVNGQVYTIVGVMPPQFQFPVTNGKTVWTALQLTPDQKTKQGFDSFKVLGRLKVGSTAEQARAEGEAYLLNRSAKPSSTPPSHFWVYPYQQIVTGNSKPGLLALSGACLLLLLIAIVNTANLQIARATARQSEIAIRAALGATRARIVRQTVIESLILAFAGAALSWMLANGFVAAARHLFARQPRFDALQFASWILPACLVITVLCGLTAAIAPSWYLMRNDQRSLVLRGGSGGRVSHQHRLSAWLVAAEVGLSTVLLIAASLFFRTLRSMENVPLGFNPERVTTFLLWPQGGNSMPMPVKLSVYQRVLDRLEHLPNMDSAGLVTSLPISNFQMTIVSGFEIPGVLSPDQKPSPSLRITAMSPDYFRAMNIPMLAGRSLSITDSASAQLVGIVNQALVDAYLHGGNPIGQQIILDKPSGILQPVTIVGVSGNVIQENSIGEPVAPELAVSFLQLPLSAQFSQYMIGFSDAFAVRSRSGTKGIAGDIRAIVKSEAPNFAIDDLVPLEQAVHDELKTQRLGLEITSLFAWIAALLSATGLYAVLAYVVGQRVHEMGIRLALGATRGSVFGFVVRQGFWMVGAGLICGWAVAFFACRWIRSFLYGFTPGDPLTYAVVGILVVLASTAAIAVPAYRSARVDPMVELRYE
jgi:putative ABC transport system permease protein